MGWNGRLARFATPNGVTDEAYWRKGLSKPELVRERREVISAGKVTFIRLHFTLKSKNDFDFFEKSVTGELRDIQLEDVLPN
jgi:hypothetical protein